jgi:hypothetical protein
VSFQLDEIAKDDTHACTYISPGIRSSAWYTMRLLHIEVKDLVTLLWSDIQQKCTLFNLSPYDTHAFHVYYKEFHRDLRAKCPNRGSATSLTTIPEEPESSVSGSATDVTKTTDSDSILMLVLKLSLILKKN